MIARLAAIVPLLLVVCITGPAAQEKRWFELYDEARQHVQRREWGPAETKILDAKRLGPPPGRTVLRYGSWRDDFFPDFYLGVIYMNTRRTDQAGKQFDLARSQGVNLEDREFAASNYGQRAGAALTAKNDPPPEVKPPANIDKPAAAAPPSPVPAPPAATPSGPTPIVQFDQHLADSLSSLKQKNYAAAENSLRQAAALNLGRPGIEDMRRRIQESQATDTVEALLSKRDVAGARAAILQLQKLTTAAGTAAYAARVDTIEREIAVATTDRIAMRAYFQGDHPRTIAVLAGLEKGGPLSPRGYFYRACSLAALALRGAQVDTARMAEARRYYREALKTPQAIGPDRRWVSPKVLQALGS